MNSYPSQVAGIALPQTVLARKAFAFARETYGDESVFNHHPRVYLWGALVAKAQGIVHDEETFFLGAMFHNLGLAKRFYGPLRFEVTGANAAADFLRSEGASAEQIDTVWQAVALHTSAGIADQMKPPVALTHIGAGIDSLGMGADLLPQAARDAVLAAFPRLDFKTKFYAVLQQVVQANPAVTVLNWMEGIAKESVPGFAPPQFKQLMQSSILDRPAA